MTITLVQCKSTGHPKPTQTFKITDNKGIIDFITTNLDYMVNLIISLQDKVKVVSPPILQERVLQTINKMKKIYEG